MSNKPETSMERMERLKREREAAKAKSGEKIVGQLTHESTGEPDFAQLAAKLQERKEKETTPTTAPLVKYTIYIEEDIANAFKALCIKRGDQKRYATQAIKEFVEKKVRELDI